MSATFNRRFALEQAVLLISSKPDIQRNDHAVDWMLKSAKRIYNWLEEIK